MVNQKKTPAIFRFLGLWFIACLGHFCSLAQTDSTQVTKDSTTINNTIRKDTTINTKDVKKNEIKTTIVFHAKDSLIFDLKNKKGFLYKDAKITYGQTQLEAGQINMDMNKNIVQARPEVDSTGKATGKPLLTEGAEKVQADSIDYNMNTQRGILAGIVTQQGEGYIGGEKVKKSAENEFYLNDGYYTTCNLEHPHFRIRARKIKLTKKQNVVAGPFNLEIADTPTPLGFFFGIFPKPKQKASGILIPTYGESRTEGFFLRNGGYYWGISEYVDLKILGEIYTYGNWGLNLASSYARRYRYTGNASVTYNTRFQEENNEIERTKIKQFWVNWSHNPVSRGTSRFSASVSAGSSTFNRTSSFVLQNQINSTFQSTVSYSKTFKGTPFSLNLSGRHNQKTDQNLVNLTLPDFNFSMSRIFPFKNMGAKSTGFLANIGINYNLTSSIQISNQIDGTESSGFEADSTTKTVILPFKSENFDVFLENADYNVRHSIPVSAPFKLLKYFNGTVSANFDQAFHKKKYDYTGAESIGAVQVDTTFNAWKTSYRYSLSTGVSTNIYGIFNFGGRGKIQAVRHMIQPNIGVSYSPDFTKDKFGFYQNTQVGIDNEGKPIYRKLAKFDNVLGGAEVGSINFSIRNTLEAKLRPKSDTIKKAEKIMLLDELSASSSYNLLADSSNLANISLSARTRINRFLDINLRGTLDPYQYIGITNAETGVETFKRTQEFAWFTKQGVGTITTASLSMSTGLSPDILKGKGSTQNNNNIQQNDLSNSNLLNPTTNPIDIKNETQSTQANPDVYVDFEIPWTLNLNFNMGYNRFPDKKITQSLSFSGDLSLTPKWRIGFNSSYDFQGKQLTATQINLFRDLHCWEMRFFWQPFGQFQTYSFTINVRASTLQDLKIDRKRTWYDR